MRCCLLFNVNEFLYFLWCVICVVVVGFGCLEVGLVFE